MTRNEHASLAMIAWRDREFYFLLVLLLGSRLFLQLSLSYTMDDAFITYRYAQNLANGEGFVYNFGERVQGTSTPLYTIMLAGCASVVGTEHIPSVSRIIALIADAVSLWILWKLLSAWSRRARFVACVLFAMYPKVVLVSISGMETPLVILLMLLSFLLLFNLKKVGPAVLIFSLLLLCRVDGIIWIAVCLWRAEWPEVKSVLRSGLVGIFLLAAWLVFSQFYFGSIVPHSVVAKSVSYAHEFSWFDPVRVLAGYFPFEGLKGQPASLQTGAVVLLLLSVVVELIRLMRLKSGLVVFPIFFLVYNLVFSLGRTIMVDWYFLPGYLALFVTLASLSESIARRVIDKSLPGWMTRALKPALVLGLAALLFVGASRWEKSLIGFHVNENIPLGKWLNANGGKHIQVLVEPIGYIGWLSESYIHDFIGLVSPQVIEARRRTPGSDRWFMEYVKERQPDFIVLRDWEVPMNRLFRGFGDGVFSNDRERVWFSINYVKVEWNPESIWQEPGSLILYKRVDGGNQ